MLLLNRNWNETKHFQLSPDLPGRAADLVLPGHPQTLATPIKEAFIYLFLQQPPPLPKITPKEKLCVTKPSDALKDRHLKRGKILK